MKSKKIWLVIAGSVLMLALAITLGARSGNTPLQFLGIIAIPGNPITSTDIVWVDQATERLYYTDRSNGPVPTTPSGYSHHGAVDVIDAANDLYIGRITTGTVGGNPVFFTGVGAAAPYSRVNAGPNGVVSTPDKKIWAGDGDTTIKVADVDPTSATYLQIIASISTANLGPVSMCGTTCGRVDEVAYDSTDKLIIAATDIPTSPGTTAYPPYLTFISAAAPYAVIGQMNFAAQCITTLTVCSAAGEEQPMYVPGLKMGAQTMPQTNADGTGAIILYSPLTQKVNKVINLDSFNCSPSGEAIGPNEHAIVACASSTGGSSFPLIIDLRTGNEVGPGITEVGGGDEVNYDPGLRLFTAAANVDGISTYPQVLGVIDAETGEWLQNLPSSTNPASTTVPPDGTGGLATTGRTGNEAALGSNNHVFVRVTPATAAGATDICGKFGGAASGAAGSYAYTATVDQGCIAVFGPTGESESSGGFHFF